MKCENEVGFFYLISFLCLYKEKRGVYKNFVENSMILWYSYGVSKLTRVLNYGGRKYVQPKNKVTAKTDIVRHTCLCYDSECGSCHAGSG